MQGLTQMQASLGLTLMDGAQMRVLQVARLRDSPPIAAPSAARSSLALCKSSASSSQKVSARSRAPVASRAVSETRGQTGNVAELEPTSAVEFYQPKVGDVVVGAVVSGSSEKLEVDIAAGKLAVMLSGNAVPFDKSKFRGMAWDISSEVTPPAGRPMVLKDEEVLQAKNETPVVVEPGTVIEAIVLGITISGVPVLSIRDSVRPLVWQRLREIHGTEEVIRVCIEKFNPAGLLCTIEGISAFLPKERMQNSSREFAKINTLIGKEKSVKIIEVDEPTRTVIVCERSAWVQQIAPPNGLVEGIVTKVESFGATIALDGEPLNGLIHVSGTSRKSVEDSRQVFTIGDWVKAVVVSNRGKIMLNTALLEREEGDMLANKEKVFDVAEETHRFWKLEQDRQVHQLRMSHGVPVLDPRQIANFDWLDFEDMLIV